MPQGFNIGPFTIRFYAILIIIGAIAGAWLAAKQAKKHGEDSEVILDLLPWLLIAGIIGARLWHVFTPSASNIAQGVTTENYLKNPVEILKMWNGGLGIPGGVIGGVLALIIYSKAKKLNFWQWADFIAPGLLIGQSIGRWGNFVNQEVYGRPSNLPWAITIDPQFRISGFEYVEKYHPLFLYESLLTLAGAGILIWVDRKFKDKLYKGDIFFGYLIWYSTVRFFLEFLRLDPSPVNGININQTSMLVVGILAVVLLVLRHTIWSDKLAKKEQADRDRKLELEEQKLLHAENSLKDEAISDEDEADLPDDFDQFNEDLPSDVDEEVLSDEVVADYVDEPDLSGEELSSDGDEGEVVEATFEVSEDEAENTAENVPDEPEKLEGEHFPDGDLEENPSTDDDNLQEEPKNDDRDQS